MRTNNKEFNVLSQNLSDLEQRRKLIMEQIKLCLELKMRSVKDTDLEKSALQSGDCELFSAKKLATVSYIKNNYNDTAFLHFSKLFHSTKVSYGTSFEDVCERVYNGVCDYCILPIESATAGKLFSFYSLIDKYDLRIFAVCDIDESSSAKRTRYALLSRTSLIYADNAQKSYLEFSLIKDASYELSHILDTASAIGASLYRIDSIPVPYDDLTFKIYHVFEADSKTLLTLRLYLEYKYPQLKTVGHYLLIE